MLALIVCLILALKPVRKEPNQEMLYPPAISRKLDESSPALTYQFPHLNSPADEIFELNSQEVAHQIQSITRVKVESFTYEGKTFIAIEQSGVLIVREDS